MYSKYPGLPLPAGWEQCGFQGNMGVTVGAGAPPPPPPPPTSGNKSCVVTLSSDTIPAGSQIEITYNSSVISNSQLVRLWVERWPDGGTISPAPAVTTTSDGTHTYYLLGSGAASGAILKANIGSLTTPGSYYIHCDLADEPNKCSGNPFCSYKGLGGTLNCEQWGWQSCSGIDVRHLTLTNAQSIFPNPTGGGGGGGSCNPGQRQDKNCSNGALLHRVCGNDSKWPDWDSCSYGECNPRQTKYCPVVNCPDGNRGGGYTTTCRWDGAWNPGCFSSANCPKSSAPASGNSPAGTVYSGER